jgi:SAM-dependent methyltransferase
MRQDERAPFDQALERARLSAYAPGEFVGQESFMRAGEILALAVQAGVGPGVSVLDLCCGVAGPGRFITSQLSCTYLGVDSSASAVELARGRAGDLPCRFEVAGVPPVPPGPFDVVLLLETLLAFPDKDTLLRGVASALPIGGRFACTVEEGSALTAAERAAMPDADTVWLITLPDLLARLERVGLHPRLVQDCSASHRAMVDALIGAFMAERSAITAGIGRRALDELLAAHQLWSDWLTDGRVRKFAVVADRTDGSRGWRAHQHGVRPPGATGVAAPRLLVGGQEPVPEAVHPPDRRLRVRPEAVLPPPTGYLLHHGGIVRDDRDRDVV